MNKKWLMVLGFGSLVALSAGASVDAAGFGPGSWIQPSREHPYIYQPSYTGFGYYDALKKAEPVKPVAAPVPPPPPPPAPEKDSDGDGVVDSRDQCPNTLRGAIVDARGCWVLKNLHFDTDKAVIKQSSFAELDQVARILKQNPGARVDVQGHTDNTASRQHNQKLSNARAEAVSKYLASRGVSAKNLQAHGFAFDRPAADNGSPGGRALNRRVELHILDR
jgi:OOP family OmpA-OmpF porin